MRCALVFPGPPEYSQLKKRQPLIHYGLGILSATLLSKGIEVDYIDCVAERLDLDGFRKRIKLTKPFLVGFTATTSQIMDAGYLAGVVKSMDNSIHTVIGGVHATALPEMTMKEFPYFDYLVYGEGIQTLPELIDVLANNGYPPSVKGLVYRDQGEIRITPERDFVKNLDDLPFPAYELLNLERYSSYYFYPKKILELPVYLSIGCPFPCKYCFRISGVRVRFRSPERVIEEIEMGMKKYSCYHFAFFDDTFGIDKKRYMDLLELMIKRGLSRKISWSAMSRVDIVDKELLDMMKRAGCLIIFYGVESGSDEILKRIAKNTTTEKIIHAFQLTRESGIKAGASFMIGLPFETRKTLKETENFISRLKPDLFDLSVFQPYPGSEFFRDVCDGKVDIKIKSFDWRFFHRSTGRNLIYRNFEEGEIDRIKWRMLVKFYAHPKRIIIARRYIYGIRYFVIGYILNILYWKIYNRIKNKIRVLRKIAWIK